MFAVAKMDNISILFVGDLQDFDVSMRGDVNLYSFLYAFGLFLAGAVFHIDRELHHLKSGIEQAVPKGGCFLALGLRGHRQVKQNNNPH